MNPNLSIFLGVLQIIFQAIAACFSYKIFTFNRVRRWWLAVTGALVLMTLRRITALMTQLSWLDSFGGIISDVDKVILPFLISVLLLWGIYAMLKNFQDFEVVEKNVQSKLRKSKK
jgi:hypothetical protein